MTVTLWPMLAFTGLAILATLWIAIGDFFARRERRDE